MKKIILAYSGGLDTSVAIKWLKEKYDSQVIALCADVGEGKDTEFIKNKATKIGAIKSHMVDAKEDFIINYVFPALKANALYEGVYPLSAALSRPLISKLLVDLAKEEGAFAVAHGCTGKGNDQVRFDVSVTALAPNLQIIAPVREWPMSREDEIDYAIKNHIPVPIQKENPYSIDANLWGRCIECGMLENPWSEPPEDAFEWTVAPEKAPDEPTYIQITFKKGIPVAINGEEMHPVKMIQELNKIVGQNGFGRIDHIENRLIGIKSREVYECPASLLLIKAHKALEDLVLTKDMLRFKTVVEQKYADLLYDGLWFSPLKEALDAFIDKTQEVVNGNIRVKLIKGNATIVGRMSDNSLYNINLATYGGDSEDNFDYSSAKGFITLWGLPTKVNSMINGLK
ncbi:MAG: argininosuccinate synthase [Thermoanaerobacterales bacterium]|jgi:argininosuccinate synthase|nr:argininosuccinate synthase [Thermoanaerobacterales bacterium]